MKKPKQKLVIAFAAIFAFTMQTNAQVTIGSNQVPAASALLDLKEDSAGTSTKALLLPRVPKTSDIVTPADGMIIYDIENNCVKVFENGAWSDCLGKAPEPSIAPDCDNNGFSAVSIVNGTAVSGLTFSVTLTNNSFSTADFALNVSDLTLNTSGLTVSSVSPATVSLISGAAAMATYTITGTIDTPMTELVGTWKKFSLECNNSKEVFPLTDCSSGNWLSFDQSLSQGLMNNTAYSGTYSISYEQAGEGYVFAPESYTVDGLTLSTPGATTTNHSGEIVYSLSGTYTGTSGQVSFTTKYGCSSWIGPYKSCKDILEKEPILAAGQDGVYKIDIDSTGTSYATTECYCDMTTDGGGWTLIGVSGSGVGGTSATEYSSLTDQTQGGYMPRAAVIQIANNSTQVQLRSGTSATAYEHKITSQPGGIAIQALRDAATTNMENGTWHRAGAVADFTGNTAISPVGTWEWTVTCTPTTMTGWPRMYHSCGNSTHVHWYPGGNRASVADPWGATWVR